MPKLYGAYGYAQIASDIDQRISAGEFAPGESIPPIAELTRHYHVSRVSVCRAISNLCSAGRLRTVHGVGTFVTQGCPLSGVMLVNQTLSAPMQREPYHTIHDVVAGARKACSEAQIPLLLLSEVDVPDRYLRRDYGCILDFRTVRNDELGEWTRATLGGKSPYVSIGIDQGFPNYVGRDTDAGTRKGLNYLYGLGHRRIAVLTRIALTAQVPVILPRAGDFPPDLDLRLHAVHHSGDNPLDDTRADMAELERIFAAPSPPTAIFAGPDALAHSAMRFLEDRGLRVPEDCSVLAYCREVFRTYHGRRLTRVDNPYWTVGYRSVKELIRTAAGGGHTPGRIFVDPELSEGETCRRPASPDAG